MEVGTVTVTVEDKQQPGADDANHDGAGKGPTPPSGPPDSKSQGGKPAPERKRARVLSEDKRFRLFSGSANRALTEEIGQHIGVKVGEAKLQRFADGEVYFQLLENVRGVDVFVVQPTCYPVDQNLMELLVMIDALKRASAARITAVVPYYGYARQDRKDRPRVAISAKLIADLLTTAGATALSSSTCTPRRFRASSTFPSITCLPARCWSAISARSLCPTLSWFRRTQAAWNGHATSHRRWARRSPSSTSAAPISMLLKS